MHRTAVPPPAAMYAQAFQLHRQGRPQDALARLQVLLRQWPDHLDGRNLAGVICLQNRDYDAAIGHLQRAVDQGAGPGVLTNLGLAHQKLGHNELAARAYEDAVRREPRLAIGWQKLGGLKELLEQPAEALACYRRAMALDPTDLKSLGEALYLRRHLADWDPAQAPTPAALIDAFRSVPHSDLSPGLLLALPEADAAIQKHAGAKFARSQWRAALAAPPLAAQPTPVHDRPLRIGYLSTDFRNHAVSFLALEVIAAHDRSATEVFLYAYGPPTSDAWRDAAIAAADHFVDVDALDDHEAAVRISRDRLDVLVDFNGYTLHARPGILAHRPAPAIAGWIGYIGTMGEARLADYVIGDAIATPLEMAPQFSESLALMPHCFQPNGKLTPAPPAPPRASEGLTEDAVVFCSFNQTHKLHPALWDDWCEILRSVPGSVLWLAPPRHEIGQRHLLAQAARRGIEPGRIVFADKRPREAHLARVALADIALDSWPYNSGTTASDALRMGVPLLCFPGETFVARMAASVLHCAGLAQCVVRDRAEYVALAVRLGNDAAQRSALRQRLREKLPETPLFRPDAFARDLERLFAAMHAQSLAGTRGPIVLAESGIGPSANGSV